MLQARAATSSEETAHWDRVAALRRSWVLGREWLVGCWCRVATVARGALVCRSSWRFLRDHGVSSIVSVHDTGVRGIGRADPVEGQRPAEHNTKNK